MTTRWIGVLATTVMLVSTGAAWAESQRFQRGEMVLFHHDTPRENILLLGNVEAEGVSGLDQNGVRTFGTRIRLSPLLDRILDRPDPLENPRFVTRNPVLQTRFLERPVARVARLSVNDLVFDTRFGGSPGRITFLFPDGIAVVEFRGGPEFRSVQDLRKVNDRSR